MNIEAIVIKHLQDELDTNAVYAEVPEKPSGEFYVVDKTGSSRSNRITTSTIAVQSYGPSKVRASEMNAAVISAMDTLTTNPNVGACRLNSDYNFTNAAKRQHRYQAVFDITHY